MNISEYYHQEYDNYNTDDMNCYYCDPNENTTLGKNLPNCLNNYFIKNQSLLRFNDEVQQRLQQLEHFQHKLALGLGLGLEKAIKPVGLPCEHRSMSTDSLNSSLNYHSEKPTSTNLNRVNYESETTKQTTSQNIDKESESESENIESVNVRELICSFEKQSLKNYEENKCCKSIVAGEERLIESDSKIADSYYPVLEIAGNQIDTTNTSTSTSLIKGMIATHPKCYPTVFY